MTITDSTIADNSVTSSSTAFGGGIYNNGMLTIEGCTIANNTTTNGSGGGLNNDESLTVTNSTFFGNTASDNGGGIGNGEIANINDCTITGNTASQDEAFGTAPGGGGIAGYSGGPFNKTTITNTIVASNDSPSSPDVAGEINSDGQISSVMAQADDILPTTGDQIGTSGSPIDPMLGSLADNGGLTQTIALLFGSPAIDKGTSDSLVGPSTTDQRGDGFARTFDDPAIANATDGDGTDIGAFEVQTAGPTPSPSPSPTPIATTFANISTRERVETGDNVLIGGFIITGTDPKKVLLRAIGPSLPLTGFLADPILELHGQDGKLIATNDNWQINDNQQEIIDTGLEPTNDLESALLLTLDPGAYTAIVTGANNGTGIGWIEAYDLDRTTDARLANISTRGFVQTGDNVMIGGFIILGSEDEDVIVRAIGPSLPLAGTLADPLLEITMPTALFWLRTTTGATHRKPTLRRPVSRQPTMPSRPSSRLWPLATTPLLSVAQETQLAWH